MVSSFSKSLRHLPPSVSQHNYVHLTLRVHSKPSILTLHVFSEYLENIYILLVLEGFSDKYLGKRVGGTKDIEDTTPLRAGGKLLVKISGIQSKTPRTKYTFLKQVWYSMGSRAQVPGSHASATTS